MRCLFPSLVDTSSLLHTSYTVALQKGFDTTQQRRASISLGGGGLKYHGYVCSLNAATVNTIYSTR